jgi:ribosomal protein S12 methylthiotransferase
VIVNTCGFIDDAVAESLDAIGEALDENGKVIVTGCLGAKGDIVRKTHPRVLAVTGPHATAEVMREVRGTCRSRTIRTRPRAALSHRHQAHARALRLSQDRGRLQSPLHVLHHPVDARRSRQPADRRSAARGRVLVKAGVKELLVISQDTSAYGVDVKYRTGFWGGRPVKTRMTELRSALGELGVWVRLHYVYPIRTWMKWCP